MLQHIMASIIGCSRNREWSGWKLETAGNLAHFHLTNLMQLIEFGAISSGWWIISPECQLEVEIRCPPIGGDTANFHLAPGWMGNFHL